MKIRRIISLTTLLSFFFLALSGIGLFFSPQGRIAYWAGWTMLGLSKEQLSAIHTTFMVLFLTTGIWHIVLNWRPIVGYLKDRSRKIRVFTPESTIAMALGALFLVGPLLGIPPFKQFLDAGEGIKAYWEASRGSPPWGHAEESRLDAFCRRVVDFQRWEGEGAVIVDCEEALDALGAAGMRVEALDQRIIEIARENDVTPQTIADIVLGVARAATPEEIAAGLAGGGGRGRGAGAGAGEGSETDVGSAAEEGTTRFPRPGSGLGRLTLRSYATQFGLDLDEMVGILAGQEMDVDPDLRFGEVASGLGIVPSEIIDALNRGG